MSKLKLFLLTLFKLCLYGIAQLIPKKRNVWVFGAWFGQKYSDNPKAFFEYINHNAPKVKAVWISKNPMVVLEIQAKGYEAFYYRSALGMYYQLRAHLVILCQSLHDDMNAVCIGKKTTVIQLWHGIPLKKIMFDVFGDTKANKNIKGRLIDAMSPYNRHRNDYILATSELTQDILSNAFRCPIENTLITGLPRNDVFFDENENESYQCIYMPTFRGGIGSECDLFSQFGFDFKKIEQQLKAHNILLVLRMHPVNKPPQTLIELISQSKHIRIDSSADIYESINTYDCLITDYSSIYFDYLLSNKPIVFAPFDLEQYKQKERSLYFNYEDVTLAPYAMNWPEVMSELIRHKEQGMPESYQANYQALQSKFHQENKNGKLQFSANLYRYLAKL